MTQIERRLFLIQELLKMCIRDRTVLCLFIGSFHWLLGLIALAAYLVVGIVIPLATSRFSGDDGMRFRTKSGEDVYKRQL